MRTSDRPALLGGAPAITRPLPHDTWPPLATQAELEALAAQRQSDISIRGNSGPIGEFEDAFREFLDNQIRWAVTFNSGTSALLAAYFALGVGPGTEVIGPDLTYHAALSPVHALGGSVVLADIDRDTRGIDPVSAESRITERTRVVTAVHQWGHPCDMDSLIKLCEKHNLALLEDCSHAHGSTYKGRACGTFGHAAVFSLQANKAIFAGEGGVLVTNEHEVHDRAVLLGHYRDRSRDDVIAEDLRRFWVTGFGLKLRMSPFNAIVALHSLRAFPTLKADRHQCLTYLNQALADIPYIEPLTVRADVDMGAWYGFKPLYLPDMLGHLTRDALIMTLRAEGMEIGVPSGPQLSTQPLYTRTKNPVHPSLPGHANDPALQPTARVVSEQALSLPTFSDWDRDRPLIDEYVYGFAKVAEHATELVEHWRGRGGVEAMTATARPA